MKIAIIHGQSHKGSTYHIAHMLAEKISGNIKEFFLPVDFGELCVGCTKCFTESETKCPHYEKLKPLTDAMDEVQGHLRIFAHNRVERGLVGYTHPIGDASLLGIHGFQ